MLARLKQRSETREIPVVLISITDESDLGRSLGAEAWFVKPVQRREILDAISQALTRRGKTPRGTP